MVTWLDGTRIPPYAVAGHLLEELLVHGHDAAKAARARWRIAPEHAALAIVGAGLPIMSTSPRTWVEPSHDPRVRARVQIRLRGHDRFVLELDDGLLVEHPPVHPEADAYLSADPAALLLVVFGRQSTLRAVVSGNAIAWGRRPQALFTLLQTLSPP